MLARFLRNDEGATMIEYGLLAALVSLVIMVGASGIGVQLSQMFTNIGTLLLSVV